MVTNTKLQLMSADDARKFLDQSETRFEKNASYFNNATWAVGILTLGVDKVLAGGLSTVGFLAGNAANNIAERYDNLESLIKTVHSDGVYIKTTDRTTFSLRSTVSSRVVQVYTYDGVLIGELGH